MTARDEWPVSGIGHCTADEITVCGRDLAERRAARNRSRPARSTSGSG